MENLFLKAVSKKDTVTANGAISNSSTGKAIIDQFGKVSNYMGRDYSDVCNDQETLWVENADLAVKFIFYLRMITRKIKVNNVFITEGIQSGQGLKDESFKRLLWLAETHPHVFNRNIWMLPIVGSWKDIWTLMFYDVNLGVNAINHQVMFELIKQGLASSDHCELIKKFMPRIKSSSKLKTDWTRFTNDVAKEFAEYVGLTIKDYNTLKANGTAHNFQKMISANLYDNINWNHIPGKALTKLVNSKFLKNHNLEKTYIDWLNTQPTAKFTGYVYELGRVFNKSLGYLNLPEKVTINKQFNHLIELAKENGGIKGNVWCALDTSGSMITPCGGNSKVTAMDVCMSLGIYFSTLNEGAFHKHVIMFDDTSHVKKLSGEFCDMMKQVPRNAMGGTNFQSVVNEIVRIRKQFPEIPLEDYPQTLLIVSDMEFNPSRMSWRPSYAKMPQELSNHEAMIKKLSDVFPKEFVDSMKFIWWNVASETTQFPATMDDGGCYLMSGFDGSVISLILGETEEKSASEKKSMTMEELVLKALNQEILLQVTI